jgi:hypothetical protein
MQTAQTALQTAITGSDAAGITAAATQIGTLTTQQVEAQAAAAVAFYAILTSTQQTQYASLKQFGLGLGGPGFGGPGGPGGGPGPGH